MQATVAVGLHMTDVVLLARDLDARQLGDAVTHQVDVVQKGTDHADTDDVADVLEGCLAGLGQVLAPTLLMQTRRTLDPAQAMLHGVLSPLGLKPRANGRDPAHEVIKHGHKLVAAPAEDGIIGIGRALAARHVRFVHQATPPQDLLTLETCMDDTSVAASQKGGRG